MYEYIVMHPFLIISLNMNLVIYPNLRTNKETGGVGYWQKIEIV